MPHGVDRVDRDARVSFSWDGDDLQGWAGEPVAVALWRAGIRVQTRSIKYHRARGPQCFTGGCPGCLVRIDGVPNQRGCQVPLTEGARVESQVGLPSAERDLLSMVDTVLPRFDHERDFVRPAPVRAVYEAVARRLAGFGRVPTATPRYEPGERLETEVLVVGAGPAGLGAAHEAGRGGAEVLLVDPDQPGGSLLHTPTVVDGADLGSGPGPDLAGALTETLPEGVHRRRAALVGLFDEGATLYEPLTGRVHSLRFDRVVLANGAHEGATLVPGSDRPGVLGARAARVLLNRWDVPPGERLAVVAPGSEGQRLLQEARARQLDVVQVDEALALEGDREVAWVETPTGRVEADAVALDPGLEPAVELAQQAGLAITYEVQLGGRVPHHRSDGSTALDHVFVAGGVAGVHEPEAALLQGRSAGALAADATPPGPATELVSRLAPPVAKALERLWEGPS